MFVFSLLLHAFSECAALFILPSHIKITVFKVFFPLSYRDKNEPVLEKNGYLAKIYLPLDQLKVQEVSPTLLMQQLIRCCCSSTFVWGLLEEWCIHQ